MNELITAAQSDRPVFLPDVRASIHSIPHQSVAGDLTLSGGQGVHRFEILLPASIENSWRDMLRRYVCAEIYNRLAALGGSSIDLYAVDSEIATMDLLESAIACFQLERSRAERTGYGRIINMLERMNAALNPEADEFRARVVEGPAPQHAQVSFRRAASSAYRDVTVGIDRRVIVGMDIGGTDIKAVVAMNGTLAAVKEYDWNPGAYTMVEEITGPIEAIVQLLAICAALPGSEAESDLRPVIERALEPSNSLDRVAEALTAAVSAGVSGEGALDAIGLCFPDVVVKNQIVGGEVPKTKGMRSNTARDFEAQFLELTRLNHKLATYTSSGTVMNTNDGPMAAFTAAVELAASDDPAATAKGIFAHTLGTDLGSGLSLADGSIPEIPLELYNLILDVGSDHSRAVDPVDVRSTANTNTGLEGTPQKLASQAAAFRFADQLLAEGAAELLAQLEAEGFLAMESGRRIVPESPVDRRKEFLSRLMELTDREERVREAFRRVGEILAIVYEETERILDTGLAARFIFGRFVKIPRVFALLQEGALRRSRELTLVVADSEMAFTPLMKELARNDHYTVAQFGQAVGAVYYGNLGLIRPELA